MEKNKEFLDKDNTGKIEIENNAETDENVSELIELDDVVEDLDIVDEEDDNENSANEEDGIVFVDLGEDYENDEEENNVEPLEESEAIEKEDIVENVEEAKEVEESEEDSVENVEEAKEVEESEEESLEDDGEKESLDETLEESENVVENEEVKEESLKESAKKEKKNIELVNSYFYKKNGDKKLRKWPLIKWGIALALVIAGFVFVGINSDMCFNTYNTECEKDNNKVVQQLKSDSVIKQNIKGYDGTLQSVALYMDNQGMENTKGSITIQLKDSKGKIIGRTSKALNKFRTNKFTPVKFEEEPELKAKETYTLIISCKKAYNPQNFGIYTSKIADKWVTGTAEIDEKNVKDNGHIRSELIYRYYDHSSMNRMIIFLVIALIIMLIPFEVIGIKLGRKLNKDLPIDKWISRVLFVISPVVAYFIMETLSEFKFREIAIAAISPKGILNIAIYGIILLVIYAITNKTQYSAVIMWIITFVFGLTNYFVTDFRGIPVLASDVLSIGTAMNVADSFVYTYDIWVLISASILVAFTSVMFSLTPCKGFNWKKRIPVVIGIIILVLGANQFFINTDMITKWNVEDSQWKPQLTYTENGSALSFTISWKYVTVKEPEGYSVSDVKKVAQKYKSDDTNTKAATKKKLPNVITIMNESLADLNVDGNFETTENYLPFIRSLKENTIKGNLYVSIEGANTANSEFEFLTGDSLAFFAARSVPYNNYVKGIVPSLARTMQSQGFYGNNSYHPYKRSGWNRENVYRSFGFNNFFSEEYYKNPKYIRNFISDETDMDQIIIDYEAANKASDKPLYLFNVTVQNHGGYVGNRGTVDVDVKAADKSLSSKSVNQYVSLAKKSDEAFEKLINYFKNVDEPTVIVMFGDHQPPLSNNFYSKLFGKNVDDLDAEETGTWYSTPYIIWANYDIEANDKLDMSANYLSSYMLNLIGADMTGYNKYLLQLQKKIPILSGMVYKGDDGKFRKITDKSEYSDLISEYSKLQYNSLFDKSNRVDDFFFLKNGNYEVEEETTTTK